jgi:hypothetical protein
MSIQVQKMTKLIYPTKITLNLNIAVQIDFATATKKQQKHLQQVKATSSRKH